MLTPGVQELCPKETPGNLMVHLPHLRVFALRGMYSVLRSCASASPLPETLENYWLTTRNVALQAQ